MAYGFVTEAENNSNLFDSILNENFYSYDLAWGGGNETFVNSRNSDLSFNRIEPIRILQDDSLVALHNRMFGDTLRFRWDILQVDHLEINRHWSNASDSIGLNLDGHTEVDGPTISSYLEKTNANRTLIKTFIDQF